MSTQPLTAEPSVKAQFPITPERFWKTFSTSLRAEMHPITEEMQRSYNTRWTPYITDFLDRLATNFSCITEPEYNRIDMPYFDRSGDNWSEWSMEAAIEVENGTRIWTHEIHKLLLLNAGLKVLIAYENTPQEPLEIIKSFPAIHKSRKYNNSGGWLFIFGPRTLPATHDLAAYTFDGEKLVDITNGQNTLL